MEYESTSKNPVLPPSVHRKFIHPRGYPELPATFTWERQKQRYSPSDLLKSGKIKRRSNTLPEFGYVFCHRGLYEHSSRIVENSASAIENGVRQGLFLHEIDIFDWENLHEAFVAHDESMRGVTKKDGAWTELTIPEIRQTRLSTRGITGPEAGPEAKPDFDSLCLTTDDRVLSLYDLLWKEKLQPSGITMQLDLRNNDFAKAIAYHSYHLDRQFLSRRNGQNSHDTLSGSLFQPAIMKGYNKHYHSFGHLYKAIRTICQKRYGRQLFQNKHLPHFPPLIMGFYSKYVVELAKDRPFQVRGSTRRLALEDTSDVNELKDIYNHIYDVAMTQISSFIGIFDGNGGIYDFILEIVHSGLGLGYNVATGEAKNPLNGKPLREKAVIFGSCVDRAMIDVNLELKQRYPRLLFSSCTRLSDVNIGEAQYKASHLTSRLEEWAPVPPNVRLTPEAEAEYRIAPTLRATHGGLYPQADLVVADDPAAEIAARTWIDQSSGLDRSKLLLRGTSNNSSSSGVEWLPYNEWLASAGRGVAAALAKINAPLLANTYGGPIEDRDSNMPGNIPGNVRLDNGRIDPQDKVELWLKKRSGQNNSAAGNTNRPAPNGREPIEMTPRTPPMSVNAEDKETVVFRSGSGHRTVDNDEEVNRAMSMLGVKPIHDRHFAIKAGTRVIDVSFEPPTETDPERRRLNEAAHMAAAEGDEKRLKTYIEAGANVNFWSGDHGTTLGAACTTDNEKLVRYLLDRGAHINGGPINRRPLEMAAKEGRHMIVQLLLENGAAVNVIGQSPCSALANACLHGHLAIVKLLLDKKADANGGPLAPVFHTPLQAACQNGHSAIVKLLLSRGSEIKLVKRSSGDFQGPLTSASGNGYESIVAMLLKSLGERHKIPSRSIPSPSKVSLSTIPEFGSALVMACGGAHLGVVRLLLSSGHNLYLNDMLADWGTPLMAACRRTGTKETTAVKEYRGRQMSIIDMLLKRAVDINFHGGRYGTALATACAESDSEIVKLLLDRGADVNTKPAKQRSALFRAYENGSRNSVQILLDNKAKIDFVLDQQPSKHQREAHTLLIKAGAKVMGNNTGVDNNMKARPPSQAPATKQPQKPVTAAPGTRQPQKPVTAAPGTRQPQKPVTAAPGTKQPQKPVAAAPGTKQPQKPVTAAPSTKQRHPSKCGCLVCRVDDSLHNEPQNVAERLEVVKGTPAMKTKENHPRKA